MRWWERLDFRPSQHQQNSVPPPTRRRWSRDQKQWCRLAEHDSACLQKGSGCVAVENVLAFPWKPPMVVFTPPERPVAPPTLWLAPASTRLPENPEKLIYLRVSMEQRLFGCQLSKDGPCAPHVNGGGIAGRTQENLWSAVPQRHNLDNTRVRRWDEESTFTTVMIISYRCKSTTWRCVVPPGF